MKSFDEILAVAEDPAYRRVVTARIPLVHADLREEHARLDALLPSLVSDTIESHPDRKAVAERVKAIEEQMESQTIEFRFQCVGHRAWFDLLAKHRPTPAQLKADKNLDHNPQTFPYEAMALSCVEPAGATAELFKRLDASGLMDTANWNEMWGACIRANVADLVPKSLAASILLRNAESSATAANGESLAASSSAA
jgi:hypothetical protein